MRDGCYKLWFGLALTLAACVPAPGNVGAQDSSPLVDILVLVDADTPATTPVGEFPGLWVRLEMSSTDVLRPYGGLSHPDGSGRVEWISPDASNAGMGVGCGRLSDEGDDLIWVQDGLDGNGWVRVRLTPLPEGGLDQCPR